MQNPLFFKCCCRWTRGVWSDDYNVHEVIEVMIIMKMRCLKWWWCIFDTSHLCLPQRAALEVDGAGPLFSNMIIVAKESGPPQIQSPPLRLTLYRGEGDWSREHWSNILPERGRGSKYCQIEILKYQKIFRKSFFDCLGFVSYSYSNSEPRIFHHQ